MGLIERVVSAEGQDDRTARMKAAWPSTIETFDLDFGALSARGFFTPEDSSRTSVLELRAIKRSLLKRLGLLHRRGRSEASRGERRRNIVMVTSTRPGEGKTFTAVNLALGFALEEEKPVVLVDGDPLRPRIRGVFGLPQGPGLLDAMKESPAKISAITTKASDAPLYVIGEGKTAGSPADAFSSSYARRVFAALSAATSDGLVVIDAPPMLATTEAFSLARHADEVVFVIEADSTPEDAVAVALDELLEVNQNVSLVLNRCLAPAGGAHYGSYTTYEDDERSVGDLGA